MNANEFIKDFIGDNEIVTVSATQLKELILQNQRLLKMVSNYE